MIAWILAARLASAGVVATPPPQPGATSQLLITDHAGASPRGAAASGVVRPGLPRQQERGLGVTDARGRVRLTPDDGGVVLVRLDGQDVGAVHVDWTAPPASVLVPFGMLVLLAAGSILVGSGAVRPTRLGRLTP